MTMQVNVSLPESLYRRVQQRAKGMNRSVADELTAVVADALAADDTWVGIPTDIATEVAQLRFLDDAHLWRAAQLAVPSEKSERMQFLSEKLQFEGLTATEEEEMRQLQHYGQRVMLVRAEAAVLLQGREFDIAGLRQPR
ncbi:MAG: hypothetical protein IAE79_00285 [Anaerolinea sp.]|nr:hypothetical protein [Anaerolinea sp.]